MRIVPDANADEDTVPHEDADGDRDGNRHGNGDIDADANPDTAADTNRYAHQDADQEAANQDAHPMPRLPDPDALLHPDRDSYAHSA